jgi:hypothetical protein
MKLSHTIPLVAAFSSILASSLTAATVTFDDITTSTSNGVVPSNYSGLNWFGFNWIHVSDQGSPTGYETGTISGSYSAFVFPGSTGTITSPTPFVFNSLYVTAAWRNDLQILIEAELGGTLVFQTIINGDPFSANFVSPNILAVDTVRISASGGTSAGLAANLEHVTIDNFTYNEAIPEPSSVLLLCLGALCIGSVRRRTH